MAGDDGEYGGGDQKAAEGQENIFLKMLNFIFVAQLNIL